MFGRVHLYLGPLVLILGAINGFLGFDFAGEDDDNIWYGVIVGVIFLALVMALFWARRRRMGKAAALERDHTSERESYEQFQRSREAEGNIPLRNVRNSEQKHFIAGGEQPRPFL